MKKCSLLFLLLPIFCLNAQTSNKVEYGLFKINVLIPGVSYELGLGSRSTMNFEASLVPVVENGFNNELDWVLFPSLIAEFRYYTNMNRRIGKGKNISGNSGNYVSFLNQALITAPILGNIEYDEPIAYLGAFNYGFQRTYGKGFYFSIAGGPAFFSGDNNPIATIYLDARIGWVLGKRK